MAFSKKELAAIAEREAQMGIEWSPGSEIDKYKKKFFGPPANFGSGKWSWCAAFVTWCCEEAGLEMPVKAPSKWGYTFALCEAWQQWAIEKGFYHDHDGRYQPDVGDIVLFDWDQVKIDQIDSDWENHIGVFLRMENGSFVCAEGNAGNRLAVKIRKSLQIQGFIKIPDGFAFSIPEDVGLFTPPALGSIEYYQDLWKMCQISNNAEERGRVLWSVSKIEPNVLRYKEVTEKTGVPWTLVAAIHGLESSFSFTKVLHNGDPLGMKTVHVPAGRGPFHTWEAAAIDALKFDGLAGRDNWTAPKMLMFAEKYNGTGYLKHHPEVKSPYVWACTNLYTKGKYVADGKFDPNVVSKQVGVAAILKAFENF